MIFHWIFPLIFLLVIGAVVWGAISEIRCRRKRKQEEHDAWAYHPDNPNQLIWVLGDKEKFDELGFVFPETKLQLVREFNRDLSALKGEICHLTSCLQELDQKVAECKVKLPPRGTDPISEIAWRKATKELQAVELRRKNIDVSITGLKEKLVDCSRLIELIETFYLSEKQRVLAKGEPVFHRFCGDGEFLHSALRRVLCVDGQYLVAWYRFGVSFGDDLTRYNLDSTDNLWKVLPLSQFSEEELQEAMVHAQTVAKT